MGANRYQEVPMFLTERIDRILRQLASGVLPEVPTRVGR